MDSKVVDGVVNLTGLVTLGSGEGLKYFETGRAQFYALIVFGGVIGLVGSSAPWGDAQSHLPQSSKISRG